MRNYEPALGPLFEKAVCKDEGCRSTQRLQHGQMEFDFHLDTILNPLWIDSPSVGWTPDQMLRTRITVESRQSWLRMQLKEQESRAKIDRPPWAGFWRGCALQYQADNHSDHCLGLPELGADNEELPPIIRCLERTPPRRAKKSWKDRVKVPPALDRDTIQKDQETYRRLNMRVCRIITDEHDEEPQEDSDNAGGPDPPDRHGVGSRLDLYLHGRKRRRSRKGVRASSTLPAVPKLGPIALSSNKASTHELSGSKLPNDERTVNDLLLDILLGRRVYDPAQVHEGNQSLDGHDQ